MCYFFNFLLHSLFWLNVGKPFQSAKASSLQRDLWKDLNCRGNNLYLKYLIKYELFCMTSQHSLEEYGYAQLVLYYMGENDRIVD